MSYLLEIEPEPQQRGLAIDREQESSRLGHLSRAPVWFFFMVFVVYFTLALFKLGSSELGIDEGRFGVSAINILSDRHQLATVSEDPLGEPGTKPYGYPIVLGAAVWLLGKTE